MDKEKEAIEFTDAALTAATGGTDEIKVETGLRLEHGDWFEAAHIATIYNGPSTFVPLMENISIDFYGAITAPVTGAVTGYMYLYTRTLPAALFSGGHVHSAPFPYPIR